MIFLTRKKQDEILKRIAANEIIFRHEMLALPMCEEWAECTQQYIDNSFNIALAVAGVKGAVKVKNTVDKRFEGNVDDTI